MIEQLDCKLATHLLLEARERKLSETESESLQFHVTRCLCCGLTNEQLAFMRRALERYAECDRPPE